MRRRGPVGVGGQEELSIGITTEYDGVAQSTTDESGRLM